MTVDAVAQDDHRSVRLACWAALVGSLILLGYAAYFLLPDDERTDPNGVSKWSTAVGGILQFGIMLGLAMLIALGAPKRELFGLRQPSSWKLAAGLGALFLLGIYVLSALVGLVLDPGEEQGLLPDEWRPDRAAQFAANAAVITMFVPVVEELLFRGLGFSLLRRFGAGWAIGIVALTFAGAHGLVEAFPLFVAFGAGLAYIRERTGSVYPGIVLHAIFNYVAMAFVVFS